MQVEQLTRRAFVARGLEGDGNVGFVATGAGAVVFDTGGDLERGRALALLVTETTGEPVAFVVNSHHHRGHCGGNAAFGGTFLYHRDAFERMRQDGSSRARAKGAGQVVFSRDGCLKVGSVFLELRHVVGHAPGSLTLVLPDEGVAFTGDELVIGRHPSAATGDLRRWVEELAWLEGLGARSFVPGHGPTGTVEDVRALRSYFEQLLSTTARAKRQGRKPEEVLAEGAVPSLTEDPACPRHRRNVELAFAQVA